MVTARTLDISVASQLAEEARLRVGTRQETEPQEETQAHVHSLLEAEHPRGSQGALWGQGGSACQNVTGCTGRRQGQ